MNVLLRLAKPLLLVLLLLASCARLNLAALHKDQVDVLASILAAQGKSTAPINDIEKQLNWQIALCNGLLAATLLAITGLVVYENKRPANQTH